MTTPEDRFASDLEICYEVLLYLSSRLVRLRSGDTLEFVTSDPRAPEKITDWCEARDYPLLTTESMPDGRVRFVIQKP